VKIARHDITHPEIAQDKFKFACSRLAKVVGYAQSRAANLYSVLETTWNILLCGSVVDPNSVHVHQAIRIGAHAGAAFFSVASHEGPVNYQLGDGPIVTSQGGVDASLVHSATWHRAFSLCVLARERDLIDSLCRIPSELFQESSTKSPEFHNLFVDAVESFWTGGAKTGRLIEATRAATDASRLDVRTADFDFHHWVPEINLLSCLHDHQKDFAESLTDALRLHQKYYSANEERGRDWYGFIAMRPLVWAAIGFDRGVPFSIDSDYFPMYLVKGN
jgi:Immunity protein 49